MENQEKENINEEVEQNEASEGAVKDAEAKEAPKAEPQAEDATLALKRQLAETSDKYLRVLAEYDNFRKRSIKERDGIYADAYVDCIKNMLPVIDNIERVLTLTGEESFMEGLKLIVNQTREALTKMGVKEIECKTFDPNLHNAVMHIEDENFGENIVAEEFQKGYMYRESVVRYSMVKVMN